MARTRKKPEERRLELVEAARQVFREKGYAATNVTDIIKEVGVSQGTFYFYFKDKEEVFDAAAEAIVMEGYNIVKEIVNRGDLSAQEMIVRIMSSYQTMELAERWTDELEARRLRYLRARVGEIAFDLYMPLVVDIVEQGVKEGLMHVLHAPATAAHILAVTWVHLDTLKGNEVLSSEKWWEAYLDCLIKITGIEEEIDFSVGDLGTQPGSEI